MTARRAPRLYFNLRSPYSWLAVTDITERYPDVADAVQWRPFWEPGDQDMERLRSAGGDFPYTPMSKDKHLYILQDVKRLAVLRNRTIRWPVDFAPHWEVAHHPYFVARDQGLGVQYVRSIGRARWEHGLDISDPEVVLDIAGDLGMDRDATLAAIHERNREDDATAALLDVFREGVFGVPFFIAGRAKFWGLDRLPAFVDSVRANVDVQPRSSPSALSGTHADLAATFDDGHAGGCG